MKLRELLEKILKDASQFLDALARGVSGRDSSLDEKVLSERQSRIDLIVSEARFRAVVEASPDAFFLFRACRQGINREIHDFVIDEVNTNAEHLIGRHRSEITGMRLLSSRRFSAKEALFERCRDQLENGSPFETELRVWSENEFGAPESQWLRVQGVPVQDAVAVFMRDVTSKKRAEEIIQEQQRAIVNASKLSALGEMAAGIAHEVNNPLAIIQSCADQLETFAEVGLMDQATVLKVAERIHSTVSRVGRIIRGLRSFARDGQNDPLELGSLEKIVGETLEFCQERFRNHSIQLRVSKIGPELEVHCRPTQISQVLLNLLNNSFDAIQPLKSQERWISVELCETRGHYLLIVADSGHGIPPEIQEKLMQPFFTTKELGKGTGLGLSIARGIIEAHGGRLYLDAEQSHTTFIIELPKPTQQDLASEAA